jgi:hypothetical protein
MYKVSLRGNDKKATRALEGEDDKSKKIEVQDHKEFRSSLNESFHMMDTIEELEKKKASSSVSMTQRLRGKSMDHSKSVTDFTKKRFISIKVEETEKKIQRNHSINVVDEKNSLIELNIAEIENV